MTKGKKDIFKTTRVQEKLEAVKHLERLLSEGIDRVDMDVGIKEDGRERYTFRVFPRKYIEQHKRERT